MTTRPTADLVRIAAAGGGFSIPVAGRSVNDLVRIASAGSTPKPRLTFTGVNCLSVNDLVRIAAAGKGCVFFEE